MRGTALTITLYGVVDVKFFQDKPPARATIQAGRLPRDALIQISAIAAR